MFTSQIACVSKRIANEKGAFIYIYIWVGVYNVSWLFSVDLGFASYKVLFVVCWCGALLLLEWKPSPHLASGRGFTPPIPNVVESSLWHGGGGAIASFRQHIVEE